jgi:flagellar basal-body rod modification protein FlgD
MSILQTSTDNTLSSLLAKSGTTGGSASSSSSNAVSATENRFLRLLTAQMQAQNPLSPLDNAQVTSQLAQISTVNGIDQLNQTLQALLSANNAGQALAAASVVGHGVLVPGDSITLSNGQANLGVELNGPADQVTVSIKDSSGRVVRTLTLGAQQAGVLPITWDGKADNGQTAADGNYSFSVNAVQGGQSVQNTTLSYGVVNGLTYSSSGLVALVSGLGRVSLDELREIL